MALCCMFSCCAVGGDGGVLFFIFENGQRGEKQVGEYTDVFSCIIKLC